MDFGKTLWGVGLTILGGAALIFGITTVQSGINTISAETGIRMPTL